MDLVISYKLFKTLHIIFFTTWMAGLFYLPRIYVYHSREKTNTDSYKTFIVMEKKLLKYIMNPSLFLTLFTGIVLAVTTHQVQEKWFIIKFILVILMAIFHMYCAKIRRDFEFRENNKTENFFRLINEIPTVLFILIVTTVIFKPFN